MVAELRPDPRSFRPPGLGQGGLGIKGEKNGKGRGRREGARKGKEGREGEAVHPQRFSNLARMMVTCSRDRQATERINILTNRTDV